MNKEPQLWNFTVQTAIMERYPVESSFGEHVMCYKDEDCLGVRETMQNIEGVASVGMCCEVLVPTPGPPPTFLLVCYAFIVWELEWLYRLKCPLWHQSKLMLPSVLISSQYCTTLLAGKMCKGEWEQVCAAQQACLSYLLVSDLMAAKGLSDCPWRRWGCEVECSGQSVPASTLRQQLQQSRRVATSWRASTRSLASDAL